MTGGKATTETFPVVSLKMPVWSFALTILPLIVFFGGEKTILAFGDTTVVIAASDQPDRLRLLAGRYYFLAALFLYVTVSSFCAYLCGHDLVTYFRKGGVRTGVVLLVMFLIPAAIVTCVAFKDYSVFTTTNGDFLLGKEFFEDVLNTGLKTSSRLWMRLSEVIGKQPEYSIHTPGRLWSVR